MRERVLAAVGPNAGLLAAAVPEFAALLAVPPEPGDPLTAQARAQLAAARALRAIASKERPVLIFLDDLQWAGAVPLGLVDLMLSEEPAEGLLLVGAYRDGDVDSGRPLVAALARWRGQPMVRHSGLASLDRPSLATMVAEMLHADPAEAADLADAIEPRTHGNPYETVELLNALRRDGALARTPAGWRWQPGVVRARLNRPQAGAPQETWLAAMPRRTRAAVEAMASLGGRARAERAAIATGTTAGQMAAALELAIEDGLLVSSLGRTRRCGSGTTAFARRSWPVSSPNGGAPCRSPWRGGWRRCPSCSRWRRSSTCRLPTPSTTPLSGGWWRPCWRARPTRRP